MQDYWYLREGDFLPEKIEMLCEYWHRSRESVIELLSASGNIFASREDAVSTSDLVRGALISHQAQTAHLSEIHTDADTARRALR